MKTDRAYQGQTEVIRSVAGPMRHCTNRRKSRVRAEVEHVTGMIERMFGFTKMRYSGRSRNLRRLEMMATLTNVSMGRRRLLAR